MNYYKAIIQYDGSESHGFQRQDGMPTIQHALEEALKKFIPGEVSTRAASRTDIGVHAIGQVIKIATDNPSSFDAAVFNSALPSHIRCLNLTSCSGDFIPSMDQVSKEYRYLFSNQEHRYIAQSPQHLNIDDIQACVDMLKGTNNFHNFFSLEGKASTTIREILECDLKLINPQELFQNTLFNAGPITSCWQFRIVGTGFLKHMVRHLVGALWLVGDGRLTVEDFAKYLNGEQKKQRPWKKADPRGLYLLKVSYE